MLLNQNEEFSDAEFGLYRKLMLSVIIQAMRDAEDCDYRRSAYDWVRRKSGTFTLCAEAWNKTPEQLQELMLTKIAQIKPKKRKHD